MKTSDPVSRYYDRYWSFGGLAAGGSENTDLGSTLSRYVTPESQALDVGCGDGRTAGVWLHSHAGRYVGVDVSATAVEIARSRGLDALKVDDAADLPFLEDTFDLAVAIEVLEHLLEPQRAVKEILRCLRPGGVLIGQVPNGTNWRHRLQFALRGRFDPMGDRLSREQPWRDPHIRFFTPSTLRRMLEQNGFPMVDIVGTARRPAREVPLFDRVIELGPPKGMWQLGLGKWPGLLGERLFFIAVSAA